MNSDVGMLAKRSRRITIANTTVQANADGAHVHYGVNERSSDVLIRDFTAIGFSEHGMVSNFGSDGAFVDGLVRGGTPLEPMHGCSDLDAKSVYKNIHGEIGPIRRWMCQEMFTVLVNVNGEDWRSDDCR